MDHEKSPSQIVSTMVLEEKMLHNRKSIFQIFHSLDIDDKKERGIFRIGIEEFKKVDRRVGTVLNVTDNKKSRNAAYVIDH